METILMALAAGAAAALKDTAGSAIKDAYEGLKSLLKRRFTGNPSAELVLAEHDKKPDVWTKPMETTLIQTGADQDPEIVHQAEKLLNLISAANKTGIHVQGSGAAAAHGGVAAGQGGIAAGGNVTIGNYGQSK